MGNLALIISTRHWTDLSLARGPEGLIRSHGQRRTQEGDYNECCISAAYYYHS